MNTAPNYYISRNSLTGLFWNGTNHTEENILKAKRLDLVSTIVLKHSFENCVILPVYRETTAKASRDVTLGKRGGWSAAVRGRLFAGSTKREVEAAVKAALFFA